MALELSLNEPKVEANQDGTLIYSVVAFAVDTNTRLELRQTFTATVGEDIPYTAACLGERVNRWFEALLPAVEALTPVAEVNASIKQVVDEAQAVRAELAAVEAMEKR